MNTLYGIYVDPQYEDAPKELIAIAEDIETRDFMISMIITYINDSKRLDGHWMRLGNELKALKDAAEEKYPIPVPLRNKDVPGPVSTLELINSRKEMLERGDIAQASATLNKISEITEQNRINNELRKGYSPAYWEEVNLVKLQRDNYVQMALSPELRLYCNLSKNLNVPSISEVSWGEIKLNVFFNHPDILKLVDEIRNLTTWLTK